MKSLGILLCLFFAMPNCNWANNVQISNVTLTNQDIVNNTYQVKFDIAWDNSWRTSTLESNYDAAWIFIKYRVLPQLNYEHAAINQAGFVAPAGSSIIVPSDNMGAFIQRSSDGIGPVNFTNVQLKWNYLSIPDDAKIEICVFAIEMVYIPGGSFFVGDGSTNTPSGNFAQGNSSNAFKITSENSLMLGGASTINLGNSNNVNVTISDDFNFTTTQVLDSRFPKGFNPFYTMKYEISQGQYADFLNNLTSAQAVNRFPGFNGSNLHTITNVGAAPKIYAADAPDRACNYLGWPDIAAYADWSGLRPMSELEYEKACRGTQVSVADELAWGSPYAHNKPYIINNNGLSNETISNTGIGTGNAIYLSTRSTAGPRRCGIISGSFIAPSRQEAGGSYYGVMEMSGNVWECTISVGSIFGRAFAPNHGNGIIGTTGSSTVGGWPAISGPNVGIGTGVRGGANTTDLPRLRTSSRDLSNINIGSRFSDVGGRLVRSLIN